MPGSVQVSVLDFKELPSSSNYVKFSLGKVEHEVGENGTFSFPLMNLRDNLIITIQDSEGNQVSQSGIRTMTIIEKGTWDDVFPIEGGGFIQMKLQFFLSDEERNRIRLMRESATKKKQAEILGSRQHEISDVLSASSSQDFQKSGVNNNSTLKASDSSDGMKEESFQEPLFTNVTGKREETSTPHAKQEIEQRSNSFNNLVVETLKDNITNDVKKETSKEMTSNKNKPILLQQAEVPEKLLEDTETRDVVNNNNNNNNVIKSEPLSNLVEKSDKQILVKKMNKESKISPFLKEAEVNTIKNSEIQLQETDLPKRLQDSSSRDVESSRLIVSEKIKSFSPKLTGEMDKQGSPKNIKKMISVFESSISQDRVPLKPVGTKSYRLGTSRLVKDYNSSLKNSEKSTSSRLRNSFSMSDLRENLSDIITKGNQVEFDNNFVEPSENIQSKGNDPKRFKKIENKPLNNEEILTKSRDNVDYFDQDKAISLLNDCKIEEKGHQEKIVASTPEIVVKGEEIENPECADVEASNGSFGQVVKIALVVGFGVVVLLFRQRESGKGKKKENTHALRNQVLMNRRGSIGEQGRRIGVSRLS